jgi:alpha-tubulin suppressor-like RCC1 family protein
VHFQVPFTTIPLKLAVTNVRAVASGLRHSAILTRDGHVLVCGNGKNGQLGLTDNNGIPIVEVEHPQKGTQNTNQSMLWDCYRRTVKVQLGVQR